MTAAKWTVAAVPTGPFGLCGATMMLYVSAIAAIFIVSLMPPSWHKSGWMTSTSCPSMSSRYPHFVNARSPVAMSIERPASRTRLSDWMLSGGTASSRNAMPIGSSARPSRIAAEGRSLPCTSHMRATSGPTASRIAW